MNQSTIHAPMSQATLAQAPQRCAESGVAPLYIALEGVKGSGKSTLLKELAAQLEASGYEVVLLCPTAPGPWWHWSELAAHVPWVAQWDWVVERRYAARSQHSAQRAASTLAELQPSARPVIILGDRSVFTSLVTRWERAQQYGVARHWRETRALEPLIPIPELVIYLDAPLCLLSKRLKLRARSYGLRDERRERLIQAQSAYRELMSGALAQHSHTLWLTLQAGEPQLTRRALSLIRAAVASRGAVFTNFHRSVQGPQGSVHKRA